MNRPTSVLVFAILHLILGAGGVLGLAFELTRRLGLFEIPTENNPVFQLMEDNAAFKLYSDVTQVVGVAATIVLIASAIGLLKMKPWARTVTIAYGVYSIAMYLMGTVVNHALIFGPMLEETAGTSGPERIGAVAAVIGAIVFTLLFTGYWILVIVFLTRRRVVAAFEDPFGDAEFAENNGDDRLPNE